MKKRFVAWVAAVPLSLVPGLAQSAHFDFEDQPATNIGAPTGALTQITLTQGSVEMTVFRLGGSKFDIVDNTALTQTGKPASWGARSLDPSFDMPSGNPFNLNFSVPCLEFSVDAGDYGIDDDTVSLRFWSDLNGTGTFLGGLFENVPTTGSFTWATFSKTLTSPFRSVTMNGGSTIGTSLFFDNIRVQSVVPEPATLLAFGVGIAWRLRHRR